MSDDTITQSEAEDRLWKALEDTRTGMLGLMGTDQHFQPMTGFEDREGGALWFFTRDDTDLARAVAAGEGGKAMYTVVTKDTKVYACLAGTTAVQLDRGKIDKYWNPVVAAWYPGGKEDPHLTLIRLDLEDARVWLNDKGPVMFMIEVAKANLTRTFPDAGERKDVTFQ
ncbi:MAG: pyridoxamine 5'-phosphate oxidase family protein [Caulobacteraceae bacterium]|nr:pyridoxamine 5'-phosphate oxidase family protein [Caulobacteraceae bacterium]